MKDIAYCIKCMKCIFHILNTWKMSENSIIGIVKNFTVELYYFL